MIPAGAAAVLLFVLVLVGIFTALIGWAEDIQVTEERRVELYDWSQDPDL